MLCFDDVADEGRRRVITALGGRKFRLTSDREDLADAVVFKAWQAWKRGMFTGGRAEFWAWISQIARNEYVMYVRKEARLGMCADVDVTPVAADGGPEDLVLAWEDVDEQRADLGRVLAALRSLKARERLAVLGHFAGKLDLELDPAGVDSLRILRYRALVKVRKMVGAQTPSPAVRVPSPSRRKTGGRTIVAQTAAGSQGR